MSVIDPVRFWIVLLFIGLFLSPVCTGVIDCEDYPAEWREEYLSDDC